MRSRAGAWERCGVGAYLIAPALQRGSTGGFTLQRTVADDRPGERCHACSSEKLGTEAVQMRSHAGAWERCGTPNLILIAPTLQRGSIEALRSSVLLPAAGLVNAARLPPGSSLQTLVNVAVYALASLSFFPGRVLFPPGGHGSGGRGGERPVVQSGAG